MSGSFQDDCRQAEIGNSGLARVLAVVRALRHGWCRPGSSAGGLHGDDHHLEWFAGCHSGHRRRHGRGPSSGRISQPPHESHRSAMPLGAGFPFDGAFHFRPRDSPRARVHLPLERREKLLVLRNGALRGLDEEVRQEPPLERGKHGLCTHIVWHDSYVLLWSAVCVQILHMCT